MAIVRPRASLRLNSLLFLRCFCFGVGCLTVRLAVRSFPSELVLSYTQPSQAGSTRRRPRTALHCLDDKLFQGEDSSIAVARAKQIVTSTVADVLFNGAAHGGLSVVKHAIGPRAIQRSRDEARQMRAGTRMQSTGQEEQGRSDVICYLTTAEMADAEMFGLSYCAALLDGIRAELNLLRPCTSPVLTPGPIQLSCYDGSGTRYRIHRDSYPFDWLANHMDEDIARHIAARSVTLILYLQSQWAADQGGALRAHAGSPDRGEAVAGCVDVQPSEGSLLLFRSRDLCHEVLPTFKTRYALTMWCLDGPIDGDG